jgi:hypothetical protein
MQRLLTPLDKGNNLALLLGNEGIGVVLHNLAAKIADRDIAFIAFGGENPYK